MTGTLLFADDLLCPVDITTYTLLLAAPYALSSAICGADGARCMLSRG